MKKEGIYRVLALCVVAYGSLPGTGGERQSTSSETCHSNSDGSNQRRRTLTSMCKYSFKECTIRNRHELQSSVCGSNGRTYKNICLMERHSCNDVGSAITLEYRGPCRSGHVTKEGATRNKMNRDGVVLNDEIHRQQCRRLIRRGCRRSMKRGPVCSTNGRTYLNECAFWKEACNSHQYISIANKGACHVTTNSQEPFTETTVMLQTEVPAECLSTCKPGFAFVCGTDSATYMSECHLKKLACRSNIDVAVQHRGVCRPRLVPNVIPRKGGYTPDTTNSPGDSSDCGRCSDLGYRPVCGTDSLTYYSACILYEYSCKLNDDTLRIKHQGQCPTDTTWNCQRRCRRLGGKEVCGTDGRTYASECHLKRRSCNRENLNLTIAYRGSCIKPSVQDACQRKCFHRYEPVCGSDGVTYLNSCFLEAARCRNSVIELVSEGICQDTVS
ncbi:Agrin [Holothuria leucospilota]|uniref:Agrin n=1 Tax=Holothuria leucospilota TaxID=206669 RepID=A0A9Q1CJ52_HOLLE|nr:Agrin [Holothuria leucospilota]